MFNLFKRKTKEQKEMEAMIKSSVEAFQNRPIYSRLTEEIINSTPDDTLEQTVFDTISQIIEKSEKEEYEAVKDLSVGQKAVYSVWCVEAEVNNGGFNQFYFNSTRVYAEMAVEGFNTFKATKFAALMEKANTIHASLEADLEKFNDGTAEGFSKSYEDNPLNDLDTEFYALYQEEDLNKLRISYIRSHTQEFI